MTFADSRGPQPPRSARLRSAQPAPEAPAEVRTETAQAANPRLSGAARPARAGVVVAGVIGFSLVAVALLAAMVYFVAALGTTLVVVAAVLALVPLAIVFTGLKWIDRWEPEPFALLLFCFLWGAGASVVIALLVDGSVQQFVDAAGGPTDLTEFAGLVIQAPIVEETAKGLGVLLVLWFARRSFDGPVDGIVYATAIAGGFAFSENIQYFGIGIAQAESLGDIANLFVLRGLMSPFAHVTFTAMTGLALGIGSRRSSALGGIGWFLLGLLPAIFLHALWNGGAALFGGSFFGWYLLVQVPIFVVLLCIVQALRRDEVRRTQARLTEYAQAGWISPDEIPALATRSGRRLAVRWAAGHGIAPLMRRYIRDATRLAFARERILNQGRGRDAAIADEAGLLAAITASRRALRGGAPA